MEKTYFEMPRSGEAEDLYAWALELCEKLNREHNAIEEEDTKNVQI